MVNLFTHLLIMAIRVTFFRITLVVYFLATHLFKQFAGGLIVMLNWHWFNHRKKGLHWDFITLIYVILQSLADNQFTV
jgi:hypothetical protein